MKINEIDNPVFVFPYRQNISEELKNSLLASTHDFLRNWNAHGQPLQANAWMEESRFLILELTVGLPSGCSKDRLYHGLEEINQKLGLEFESFGKFLAEWKESVHSLSIKELKQNILNADFLENARLFPSWINTRSQYDLLWKKPLSSFPALLPSPDLV
jgi:hypothetical protein